MSPIGLYEFYIKKNDSAIVGVYGMSVQISRPSLKTPGIPRPSRLAPVDPSDRLRGTIALVMDCLWGLAVSVLTAGF